MKLNESATQINFHSFFDLVSPNIIFYYGLELCNDLTTISVISKLLNQIYKLASYVFDVTKIRPFWRVFAMKSNEYLIYNPERAFRDIATAWAIVIETELNVLRCAHSLAKNTLRKTVIQDLPSFLLIGCSLWISVQVLQNIIGTEKSRKVLEEFSGLALIPLNDLLFGSHKTKKHSVTGVRAWRRKIERKSK
ncbi:hypothetical protein B9Q01_00295 [Candidatus Marsarchaeota G1 archaeon OSP_D]|uniref:Uncharacterized protein n=3 Tax=Candidatus Marsarchaeota group 1 TaxID=2203770 RepID=A0A2R6AJK8_9ARCH|nr:MAG: hypothetical protein B9Q01_00295 [Candidatus Marsarchaeota G1 archaeon OSP_D]PSN86556.1 MAG: hypothetical protein B9Q02_01645 [Candidatus Marsarchaeota G1 archaeon BE_D]PSN89693.1 MAG: hypothetical protein B9Q00_00305 [Candidatus Marsarchaeota G1 archaeon OSP_C]